MGLGGGLGEGPDSKGDDASLRGTSAVLLVVVLWGSKNGGGGVWSATAALVLLPVLVLAVVLALAVALALERLACASCTRLTCLGKAGIDWACIEGARGQGIC